MKISFFFQLWPLFGGTLTKPEKGKLFYIPQVIRFICFKEYNTINLQSLCGLSVCLCLPVFLALLAYTFVPGIDFYRNLVENHQSMRYYSHSFFFYLVFIRPYMLYGKSIRFNLCVCVCVCVCVFFQRFLSDDRSPLFMNLWS